MGKRFKKMPSGFLFSLRTMWALFLLPFCSSLSSVCLFATLEFSAHFCCVWTGSVPITNSLISCSQVLRLSMKRHSLKLQTVVEQMSPYAAGFSSLFPICLLLPKWFSFLIALHLVSAWQFSFIPALFLDKSFSYLLGVWLPGPYHSIPHSDFQKPGPGSGALIGHITGKICHGFLSILSALFFLSFFFSHRFQRESKLSRTSLWGNLPNASVKPFGFDSALFSARFQPTECTFLSSYCESLVDWSF